MGFDTPLVEYLIIGMHTSTWVFLVYMKLLDLPITILSKIDTVTILLLLPFIYIAGMIFDDVTFRLLSSRLSRIKKEVFGSRGYKDELIAFKSEVLYNAYEARIRRVRIIAAAIFNWPLLGFSIAINIGFTDLLLVPLIISIIILTILTWFIWHGLINRAYKFRKNAIDVITKKISE